MFFGSPGGRFHAGESYVIFGRDTAATGDFPAELELSSLASGAGSVGFVVNGIDADDWSGRSVSGAGDVNGDGVADIIVGASGADPGGRVQAGESYVVFGRTDTDQDGVHDAADNCLAIANPGQEDTNGDNIGNACDADLTDDCLVNFGDLAAFKAVFFPSYGADADFDGDGSVNFGDLATMKATFFNGDNPGPGPSGLANACDGS